MMSEKERGRLFFIGVDGSDSMPYIIKKDRLLFGRGDSCEIRVYVDGVSSEHCVITFNSEGRGFLEPINKCGLTFLNGELIERQLSLEHDDVITVVKRSFRFAYSSSSKFYVQEKMVNEHVDNVKESVYKATFVVNDQSDYAFHKNISPNLSRTGVATDFNSDILGEQQQDMAGKRVTFGPRLTPEEFDRNMPPASPLRRGSLPGDKYRTPPCHSSAVLKSLYKQATPKSDSSTANSCVTGKSATSCELLKSSLVFRKLKNANSCEKRNQAISLENKKPRLLFSEVLQNSAANPSKNVVSNKITLKTSPKHVSKKSKLLDIKKSVVTKQRRPVHQQILAVGSTGHANSPETIVICKKRSASPSVKKNPSKLVKNSENNCAVYSSTSSANPASGENEIGSLSAGCQTDDGDIPSILENYSCHTTENQFDGGNMDICPHIKKDTPSLRMPEKTNLRNGKKKFCNSSKSVFQSEEFDKEFVVDTPSKDKSPIDEHSINKSLEEIHNAVQAFSCHSSISPSATMSATPNEMCMNAVKKLALTISMVNAFHTYNQIIKDISNFPLCFSNDCFGPFSDLKCLQSVHQNNEQLDVARLSWFEDIMHNFFSNSVPSEVYERRKRGSRDVSSSNNVNSEVSSSSSFNHRIKEAKFVSASDVQVQCLDSNNSENEEIYHECADRWINMEENVTDEMKQVNASNEVLKCNTCNTTLNSVRSSDMVVESGKSIIHHDCLNHSAEQPCHTTCHCDYYQTATPSVDKNSHFHESDNIKNKFICITRKRSRRVSFSGCKKSTSSNNLLYRSHPSILSRKEIYSLLPTKISLPRKSLNIHNSSLNKIDNNKTRSKSLCLKHTPTSKAKQKKALFVLKKYESMKHKVKHRNEHQKQESTEVKSSKHLKADSVESEHGMKPRRKTRSQKQVEESRTLTTSSKSQGRRKKILKSENRMSSINTKSKALSIDSEQIDVKPQRKTRSQKQVEDGLPLMMSSKPRRTTKKDMKSQQDILNLNLKSIEGEHIEMKSQRKTRSQKQVEDILPLNMSSKPRRARKKTKTIKSKNQISVLNTKSKVQSCKSEHIEMKPQRKTRSQKQVEGILPLNMSSKPRMTRKKTIKSQNQISDLNIKSLDSEYIEMKPQRRTRSQKQVADSLPLMTSSKPQRTRKKTIKSQNQISNLNTKRKRKCTSDNETPKLSPIQTVTRSMRSKKSKVV